MASPPFDGPLFDIELLTSILTAEDAVASLKSICKSDYGLALIIMQCGIEECMTEELGLLLFREYDALIEEHPMWIAGMTPPPILSLFFRHIVQCTNSYDSPNSSADTIMLILGRYCGGHDQGFTVALHTLSPAVSSLKARDIPNFQLIQQITQMFVENPGCIEDIPGKLALFKLREFYL